MVSAPDDDAQDISASSRASFRFPGGLDVAGTDDPAELSTPPDRRRPN
ncbi:hypothetical protein [Mycobacterium attenuatum]|nr:hypothetical protein [Mycobacterium attenuatum]